MSDKTRITVPATKENISDSAIQAGPGLLMRLPPELIFRRIFFYVEAQPPPTYPSGNDYYLIGQMVLSYKGSVRAILNASIGQNNSTFAPFVPFVASVISNFVNGSSGSSVLPNPNAIMVTLGSKFKASTVVLNPHQITCECDELVYLVQDWSRNIPSLPASTVVGFRALAHVESSSHEF